MKRRCHEAAAVALTLQVETCQTGVLSGPSKNARARCLVIMKGEDEVRPGQGETNVR